MSPAPIEIIDRPSQHTIQIHGTVGVMKIAGFLGTSYAQLTQHLKAVNSEMAGAPFAQYTDLDIEKMTNGGLFAQVWQMLTTRMNIQAGFPVSAPLDGHGNIIASEVPAGRYIRTVHTGPYHKVGQTYRQIAAWARAEGVRMGDRSIESYIDDPAEVASADVRTEVFVPVAG